MAGLSHYPASGSRIGGQRLRNRQAAGLARLPAPASQANGPGAVLAGAGTRGLGATAAGSGAAEAGCSRAGVGVLITRGRGPIRTTNPVAVADSTCT